MIKPIQEVHGLLGARQDIEALSDMQKCRLLVASDSHGEGNTLLSVLKAKGSECDAMVFCGDGASDVMYCVSAALQDGADYMPNVVAFVGGNNDYSKCPVSFDPNNGIVTNEYNTVAVPSRQVVQAAGHTVFVTHGHKQWVRVHNAYALSDEAKMAGADVVLFGHTHVAEENDGDVLYLNPGSLRYPRGDGGTSFAILDLRREGGADASFYHVSATRRGGCSVAVSTRSSSVLGVNHLAKEYAMCYNAAMNSNFPSIIKGKHFHLVGIKGTGMAALAELLAAEGALVTGSDVADVFYTDEIIKRLGVCAMSFDSGNITDDVDCVVHSSAYSAATNADLIEATKRRLPIVLYTEALGAFSQRAYSVGICGVHGKTSTTGLVGTILHRLPMASAALAGSVITSFGAPPVHSCVMTTPAWGTMSGGKRYFAAETCEYQRHFMSFHPQKIILTSVESDHQDYYPTYDSIIEAFVEYLCLLPIGGEVIYCADDEGACLAVQKVRDKRGDIMATPYGFTADGDYRITLGGITEGTQHFSLSCLPNIELHISGKHEVLDAAAAVAAVRSLLAADGRDARHYDEAIRAGVADFAGGKRRSEVVAHCMVGTNDTIFIDDYGHHPTAIRTTLAGFRQFYPGRRIIVDFMSHTYTRTAALLEEFASAFDNADDVVINKIYGSAREGGADVQEMTIDGAVISGKILAERAKKYHKHVVYAAEADEAARVVRTMLEEKPLPQYPNGCLFVTMGAGDNWKVGQSVIGELCRK